MPQRLKRSSAQRSATIGRPFCLRAFFLTILGLLAIALPLIASLTITLMLGWLLLVSGIFGLAVSFWDRTRPGFWWSLLSAVLAIATGVLLIGWPAQGALSLTIVLGAYFLAEGVTTIMYAMGHRGVQSRWGWLLAAGIHRHHPRNDHLRSPARYRRRGARLARRHQSGDGRHIADRDGIGCAGEDLTSLSTWRALLRG